MMGPGPPPAALLLVATTYLPGVEIRKAHHVAIFLECNDKVHHRSEGEGRKDWGEWVGLSRCSGLTRAGRGLSVPVAEASTGQFEPAQPQVLFF